MLATKPLVRSHSSSVKSTSTIMTASRLLSLASLLVAAIPCHACSDFMMENPYRLSVRTYDLEDRPKYQLQTAPRGRSLAGALHSSEWEPAKYGALVSTQVGNGEISSIHQAGLNEAGLSCDLHALANSSFPRVQPAASRQVQGYFFCNWALAYFRTAREVQQALLSDGSVQFYGDSQTNSHFVVRDQHGNGTIAEFVYRQMQVYEDNNDSGQTGYGVFTNDPPFPWHIQNVKLFRWKQSLARPSTVIPGNFYPDERFLRIHLLKAAMNQPNSYQEAVEQALHVMNSVTVPMGEQQGTDSGSDEGRADHTHFGHIYDHRNRVLYFRHYTNLQLQRLRLEDLNLKDGAKINRMPYNQTINQIPWFTDATDHFISH